MTKIKMELLVLILVLTVAGCATTTTNDSWSSPGYAGTVSEPVLIVGMSKDKRLRTIFEQSVRDDLGKAGVRAVISSEVAPEYEQLRREIIEPIVKREGYGSVFIARLVDRRREIYLIPGRSNGRVWNHGYSGAWRNTYQPDTYITADLIFISMELYDVKSGEMVWTATTESFNPRTTSEVASSLSALAMKSMKEHGLL
jgi:hypothetical protein